MARERERERWVDEWMTCDFTSFSTVFQSYQDDERLCAMEQRLREREREREREMVPFQED